MSERQSVFTMATSSNKVCVLFVVWSLLMATVVSQVADPLPAVQDKARHRQQQQQQQQQVQQQQLQQQQVQQHQPSSESNYLQNVTVPREEPPLPPPRNDNINNNNNQHNNNNQLGGAGAGDLEEDEYSPVIGPSDSRDDQSRRRRRNRRCKCVKRFMKEVDQLIDEKLEHFEHKYLRQANLEKERALALQNEASSTASRLQGLDKAMLVLTTDVVQTKETLALMSSNLEVLRYELNHTRGDVRHLNDSFRVLNGAVDRLSRFVTRVERLIPSGMTRADADRLGAGGALGGVGGGGGGLGFELDADPLLTYPRNCDEVYRQGGMQFQGDYYIMIKPDGVARPFKVLCKIFNNSGWTVIQKRQDGSVDFFRTWQEYRKGFGSLEGEFWLGNDYIHHLSVQEPTVLRIELTDWEDRQYYAEYDSFRIDNEKGLYRLHIGSYQGDAGDSLRSHWENHDGMPFSTKDRDNDGRYYDSCAEHFHGAWWFNNCFDSHLNGKYYHKGFHKNYFQRDGIQWNTIHMYSSLKSVLMMVKPAVSVPVAALPSSSSVKGAAMRNKRGRGKGRRASRKDRKKE